MPVSPVIIKRILVVVIIGTEAARDTIGKLDFLHLALLASFNTSRLGVISFTNLQITVPVSPVIIKRVLVVVIIRTETARYVVGEQLLLQDTIVGINISGLDGINQHGGFLVGFNSSIVESALVLLLGLLGGSMLEEVGFVMSSLGGSLELVSTGEFTLGISRSGSLCIKVAVPVSPVVVKRILVVVIIRTETARNVVWKQLLLQDTVMGINIPTVDSVDQHGGFLVGFNRGSLESALVLVLGLLGGSVLKEVSFVMSNLGSSLELVSAGELTLGISLRIGLLIKATVPVRPVIVKRILVVIIIRTETTGDSVWKGWDRSGVGLTTKASGGSFRDSNRACEEGNSEGREHHGIKR
jgi:hypothetical protein